MMHTSGGGCLLIVLVVLAEARPGRFLGWLIGCFRCFTLLPSGERSSPLGSSADVQVFSMVFTFGACSSSILGAHHTSDCGGARTLDPCVSSFVLIPRVFATRLSARGCWGKPSNLLIVRVVGHEWWLLNVSYNSFIPFSTCKLEVYSGW